MLRTRTPFLGLAFDPIDAKDAAAAIAVRASQLQPLVYVASPNVDRVMRVDRNPELRALYNDAWLTLCDSRILEIFARYSRVTLPAASATNIIERLFIQYIKRNDRVVVIGGSASLVAALRDKFSLLDLRRHETPRTLDAAARQQCIDFIRNNPAPFVFVATGSPQQEQIAHEAMNARGLVGVAICCGASLKAVAGSSRPGRRIIRRPRLAGAWRRWSASH